jgi:hypothetical protein
MDEKKICFTLMSRDAIDSLLNESPRKYQWLKEYLDKGLIVHKSPAEPRYYVMVAGDAFSIDDEESFRMFIQDPRKFRADHIKERVVATVEILYGMNRYENGFPGATDVLIRELADSMGVKEVEPGNLSRDVLKKMDKKVITMTKDSRNRLLLHFIALIGESVKRQYPGRCWWQMELSDDRITWNPILEYEGQWVDVVASSYKNLIERKLEEPLTYTYDTILIIIQRNLKHGHK